MKGMDDELRRTKYKRATVLTKDSEKNYNSSLIRKLVRRKKNSTMSF